MPKFSCFRTHYTKAHRSVASPNEQITDRRIPVRFGRADSMLRRNVRLRKEYLHKKALEDQENVIRDRKKRIKEAIAKGKPVLPEDRNFEAELRGQLELEDENSLAHASKQDDEYAYAETRDPHLLITTSRDPSSRLLRFVKELKLLFPNADRVNRGSYVMGDLVKLCQANDVTDLVLVHEHRGIPDSLVVSHMPLGPTAYFSLEDVVLRHDLPNKPPPMSIAAPHLVFDNFTSHLGERLSAVLKYLFPPASPLGKRVLSFTNRNDKIHFRHFVWSDDRHDSIKDAANRNLLTDSKPTTASEGVSPGDATSSEELKGEKKVEGNSTIATAKPDKSLKNINLTEVGPRFVLKPYRIELGTVDQKDLEVEWSIKPFLNKPRPVLAPS